jgi:hypothetical protein
MAVPTSRTPVADAGTVMTGPGRRKALVSDIEWQAFTE